MTEERCFKPDPFKIDTADEAVSNLMGIIAKFQPTLTPSEIEIIRSMAMKIQALATREGAMTKAKNIKNHLDMYIRSIDFA